MIKFSEKEKEEILELLKLYDSNDIESKKLAQSLVLSSSWFKKIDPDSRLVDEGYVSKLIKCIFEEENFRFQYKLLNEILYQKDYPVLVHDVTIELTNEEEQSRKSLLKVCKLCHRFRDGDTLIRMARKSALFKKLIDEKIYIRLKTFQIYSAKEVCKSLYYASTISIIESLSSDHWEEINFYKVDL